MTDSSALLAAIAAVQDPVTINTLIDLLYKVTKDQVDLSKMYTLEEVLFLTEGKKIQAIKSFRDRSGLRLQDCKAHIDKLQKVIDMKQALNNIRDKLNDFIVQELS